MGPEVGVALAGPLLLSVVWLLAGGPDPSDVLPSESLERFETLGYLLGSKSPSGFRFKGILIR